MKIIRIGRILHWRSTFPCKYHPINSGFREENRLAQWFIATHLFNVLSIVFTNTIHPACVLWIIYKVSGIVSSRNNGDVYLELGMGEKMERSKTNWMPYLLGNLAAEHHIISILYRPAYSKKRLRINDGQIAQRGWIENEIWCKFCRCRCHHCSKHLQAFSGRCKCWSKEHRALYCSEKRTEGTGIKRYYFGRYIFLRISSKIISHIYKNRT